MKKIIPFDIRKAKAGAKVCTRDGRNVKILCLDLNNARPVCAVIPCMRADGTSYEMPYTFYADGIFCKRKNWKDANKAIIEERAIDLMIEE